MIRPHQRPNWALDAQALVAVDMTFLGRRLIIGEFAVGVAGTWLLGLWSLRAGLSSDRHDLNWSFWVGLELLFIGLNYLPLLLLSVRAGRDEKLLADARRFVRDRPAAARALGLLQGWIIVPLAVVAFAVLPPATSTFNLDCATDPPPAPPLA